jgi:hypothetical protein
MISACQTPDSTGKELGKPQPHQQQLSQQQQQQQQAQQQRQLHQQLDSQFHDLNLTFQNIGMRRNSKTKQHHLAR